MADPWIRVHANLSQKRVVWRLCDVLGVSKHEAVGLLVTFWGNASQFAANGHVATLPDAQVEEWARWPGQPGIFAAWVRAHHVDDDGRIREWDDYCGKLEERREQGRLRKAADRERVKLSAGHPQDVRGTSGATRRDDDVTKEAAASAPLPTGDYLTRCVVALNTGMQANPNVSHPREVATSTQAHVVSWESDGIPVDVAVTVIADRASKYKPSGRNRQVNSLLYFDNAVREAWEEIRPRVVAADGSAKLVPGARSLTESALLARQGFGVA